MLQFVELGLLEASACISQQQSYVALRFSTYGLVDCRLRCVDPVHWSASVGKPHLFQRPELPLLAYTRLACEFWHAYQL